MTSIQAAMWTAFVSLVSYAIGLVVGVWYARPRPPRESWQTFGADGDGEVRDE